MLYIFEMANNHQGSVEHAKRIIDEFSKLAKRTQINAAIKLQFRQLDTFIHSDYKDSDLKIVKRLNSTRLSKEQFSDIVEYIKYSGLIPIATPFDNESLPWFDQMDIPAIKVASCSIDDWPLLEQISQINKKIIISTAGANMETLKKVYNLFKSNNRDFAFMHCVGEYPTPVENSNLNRIGLLKNEFPDIEIGFSTHESPLQKTMSPYAVAIGCTILEKHVGIKTDTIDLNKYSNTPEHMEETIKEIQTIQSAMQGISSVEKDSLLKLKRGAYLKKRALRGDVLNKEDIYYALPVQEDQYNASHMHEMVGRKFLKEVPPDGPITKNTLDNKYSTIIHKIIKNTNFILNEAKVPISGLEKVEISCHRGIENFFECGALIIDKINREYCKKLIIMFPNQRHPTHHHIKKEEAFELLYGDCNLVLNNKSIKMQNGKPILIHRGAKHSFSSRDGCIIEEISTTHNIGDSIYENPIINSLKIGDRKISLEMWDIKNAN